MYQIAVKNGARRTGVVNSLTWKRLRSGRALVRGFHVVYGPATRAAIRFDYKEEAAMVSKALREKFGLKATVEAVEWGLN